MNIKNLIIVNESTEFVKIIFKTSPLKYNCKDHFRLAETYILVGKNGMSFNNLTLRYFS